MLEGSVGAIVSAIHESAAVDFAGVPSTSYRVFAMSLTLEQTWGVLLLLGLLPLVGALPLVPWLFRGMTGQDLRSLGTGNPSVSAAFYHGGKLVGIGAALAEAGKGIGAVLLARQFFEMGSPWELVAIAAVVMGRYWVGGGAGTTNATWGCIVHGPVVALLTWFLSFIGFTLVRDRQTGRLVVLVLYPLLLLLLDPHRPMRAIAAAGLAGLLFMIYRRVPDDLDLTERQGHPGSRRAFRFFRGDRSALALTDPLDGAIVGPKAATLSRLLRWGYPVPLGWVLRPGDDPMLLANHLAGQDERVEGLAQVRFDPPLIARSSAVGEDSDRGSAAGQYDSIADLYTPDQLVEAIAQVFESYDRPGAVAYRRDRQVHDGAMAVLVQPQIQGIFSGVAFSRDPISRCGDAAVVEALPGGAAPVVSGQVSPESYRIDLTATDVAQWRQARQGAIAAPPSIEAEFAHLVARSSSTPTAGNVPSWLIREAACWARDLEERFNGVPQDVEWTFDGQQLWILQARPVTTLLPIWTRKLAAEAIPGAIRPLTWSINQPLTCGVWGDLFRLVLGDRAADLDFQATATLHHGRAYFNATLMGEIFQRMGLPPSSLEFLTQGAPMGKPSTAGMLRNLPGLLRLVGREITLPQRWRRDYKTRFAPALETLGDRDVLNDPNPLSPEELMGRADLVMDLLTAVTMYQILAPLSFALRQSIFKAQTADLDASAVPEVAAARWLKGLGERARPLLDNADRAAIREGSSLFGKLADTATGREILENFAYFLETYGYLSEVGTDIAVPTWREDPKVPQSIFAQYATEPLRPGDGSGALDEGDGPSTFTKAQGGKNPRRAPRTVRRRLELKGQVATVYDRLLAELRWCFVAIARQWTARGWLKEEADIFFLELAEVREFAIAPEPDETGQESPNTDQGKKIQAIAQRRREVFERDRQLAAPYLVYGNDPPNVNAAAAAAHSLTGPVAPRDRLQGIGASPGQIEGVALVLDQLRVDVAVDRSTILVVPHTDAGWAPLLAKAGGLICEVGGLLSHGAIVAREYGIPAVLGVPGALNHITTGQRLSLDGTTGAIALLQDQHPPDSFPDADPSGTA